MLLTFRTQRLAKSDSSKEIPYSSSLSSSIDRSQDAAVELEYAFNFVSHVQGEIRIKSKIK